MMEDRCLRKALEKESGAADWEDRRCRDRCL